MFVAMRIKSLIQADPFANEKEKQVCSWAHLRLVQPQDRGHLARMFPTRANARQSDFLHQTEIRPESMNYRWVHDKIVGVSSCLLPEVLQATGELAASGGDYGIGTTQTPEHTRVFEALTDDSAATCFDDAGTDKISGAAELRVTHGFRIVAEVGQMFAALIGGLGIDREVVDAGTCFLDELFDTPHIQKVLPSGELRLVGTDVFGQVGEVFPGVVEIDDVNGSGEVG